MRSLTRTHMRYVQSMQTLHSHDINLSGSVHHNRILLLCYTASLNKAVLQAVPAGGPLPLQALHGLHMAADQGLAGERTYCMKGSMSPDNVLSRATCLPYQNTRGVL